ncbi:MAG: hypothetical protein HC915_18255 [Anaerolineae bacterium]|nr:hypothetical protein [Anaerolineae bacterium]
MLLYQEDAELLFPTRLIPLLRDMRGQQFADLVDRVQGCGEKDVETLGFVLMMIRLTSCLTCSADSFRAMNGCTRCAFKAIRGFKGTDADLIARWQAACADVQCWQAGGPAPSD